MRFIKNRSLQFLIDAFIVALALMMAYGIRFEGIPPRNYLKQFLLILPYLALLRMGLLILFGVYRLVWRYISLRDLPRILLAIGTGSVVLVVVRFGLAPALEALGFRINPLFATVPYGVLAVELLLTSAGIISARIYGATKDSAGPWRKPPGWWPPAWRPAIAKSISTRLPPAGTMPFRRTAPLIWT